MNKKLKAYQAYDKHLQPQAGACLVFAYTAREAVKLAYSTLNTWHYTEYIGVRVSWLREKYMPWIYTQSIKNEPHVIESPWTCEVCNTWGNEPNDNNICKDCKKEMER